MMLSEKIKVVRGDITQMRCDAIVNAANTELVLGSGVAGAIKAKGGPRIQRECDRIGQVPLGEAAVTEAGTLNAKYVIHAAGMRPGGRVDENSLRSTTLNSLKRAQEKGIKTIAFPAIGTGVGGLPLERCAKIMIDCVIGYLDSNQGSIEILYLVLFDEHAFQVFNSYLEERRSNI